MAKDNGLARIQARLNAIPRNVHAAVRRALEKSADEIVKMAQSLCPVDEGDLRASIGWTWGDIPNGSMAVATINPEDGLRITIFAGNDEAYYAKWVEFGTQAGIKGQRVKLAGAGVKQSKGKKRKSYRTHSGTQAQPFFYPAFRLNKKRAQARIKREVTKAIKANWGTS